MCGQRDLSECSESQKRKRERLWEEGPRRGGAKMWRGLGLTLALTLVLSGGARATDKDVLEEIQRDRLRQVQIIRSREGKYGKLPARK